MNIPSEYRIAGIVANHAMILRCDANPKPDGIFGKDTTLWPSAKPASPRPGGISHAVRPLRCGHAMQHADRRHRRLLRPRRERPRRRAAERG